MKYSDPVARRPFTKVYKLQGSAGVMYAYLHNIVRQKNLSHIVWIWNINFSEWILNVFIEAKLIYESG